MLYGLRRTFETIGGESRDQVAVDVIMGHARGDMASVYRERISDERLRAVVEHVRQWLFSKQIQVCSVVSRTPLIVRGCHRAACRPSRLGA
jgi:hypothetical protein